MGNPYGCTLKFKTREELEKAIQDYFDNCDNRVVDIVTKDGIIVKANKPKPYGVAGLAASLGVDRRTLLNYGERELFSDLISSARARIEACQELMLQEGNDRGAAFSLKNNHDWSDKTEIDITGNFNNNVNIADLDGHQFSKLINTMLDDPSGAMSIFERGINTDNDD
jgi:hypothetical protein